MTRLAAHGLCHEANTFTAQRLDAGEGTPPAWLRSHVTHVIAVDTPGVTSADLRRFSYRHRRRPLHPFEAAASFPEG